MTVIQAPCSNTFNFYLVIYCFRYTGYVEVAKTLDNFLLNMCTTQHLRSRNYYLYLYNNFLCLLGQNMTTIIHVRLYTAYEAFLNKSTVVTTYLVTSSEKCHFFDSVIFFSKLAIRSFLLVLEESVNCLYQVNQVHIFIYYFF